MNLNAYAYGPPEDRRWIVVDVGVTFGDDSTPGVDLIARPTRSTSSSTPTRSKRSSSTHAHEDHIGAIGWLWPRLRATDLCNPVHCLPSEGRSCASAGWKTKPICGSCNSAKRGSSARSKSNS